ncbi:MAG TPA: hypothetical protein VKI17_07535 [Gemmataceae bacterium]|nr:hypothetical protein [Gemmataceae bacterium]
MSKCLQAGGAPLFPFPPTLIIMMLRARQGNEYPALVTSRTRARYPLLSP